jgi:uncharacterized protein YabE (DUF348 family)
MPLWYTGRNMQFLRQLRSNPKWMMFGGAVLIVLLAAVILSIGFKKDIVIIVDGEAMQIRSGARTVASALNGAGFKPGPDDQVFPDEDNKIVEGDVIELRRARRVWLEIDNQAQWIHTAEISPVGILNAAGVTMEQGDRLWADGVQLKEAMLDAGLRPLELRLKRAMNVLLDIGGEDSVIRSAASTIGEALWENGIQIVEGDEVTPPVETPLANQMLVTVLRSRPLQIEVDGNTLDVRVVADTVGDALSRAGVALVGLDYAVPNLNAPIPESGLIQVIRVQEQVLVEQTAIPFSSFYQPASEIEIDNEVVLQTGAYGLNASRVRVRLENGAETGRTIEGEWVVREPEPRIIGYGTNIIIRTLNTPDGPIEYWRAVEMFATSYSPCRLGPGSTICSYTARSGLPVQQGLVAFLPEWYDYMALTQVYVPGYGIGTVGDTGWGLRGRHWIDLAYGEDDWVSWASNVTVYFLTPVPSEIMWILYVRD